MATKPIPRGIRNNNPGNIDRNGTAWQGMAVDQSSDPRFIVFQAPKWGIRALCKVLLSYSLKAGTPGVGAASIDTVYEVIHRWAPPVENDTEAYVAQVAKALGVAPKQALVMRDPAVLAGFAAAIIAHENGQQPYSTEQIREGVSLALLQ
ncbi:structural protein P5 [Xylophilus rhododendri]|uniref:Structural protein P5 n=1 Tax=Xylophilus rhododendri TaxID=2697032 RepID=A0A857J9E5_9BURK|nr:structural protein P5 [Xylophilus rhododendri]QHI99375.1 structural protein P5 [Xylophilus rhododendri]